MSTIASKLVQRVWNYAHVLKDSLPAHGCVTLGRQVNLRLVPIARKPGNAAPTNWTGIGTWTACDRGSTGEVGGNCGGYFHPVQLNRPARLADLRSIGARARGHSATAERGS